MYESRKNMGDVCKDVSSAIEERKDVLSEEHEHHRDSEPRQDEIEFHLSDAVGLGIENYVIHDLRKVLEHLGIIVKMRTYDKVYNVLFSNQELQSVRNIYGYIKAVCIEKFEKVVK